jgi:hypothetical protein
MTQNRGQRCEGELPVQRMHVARSRRGPRPHCGLHGRSRGTPIRRDGLRPSRTRLSRSRPLAHIRGFEGAWGWPYSGPRVARTSGVNAGESAGPCRGSCRARQQVRGSVVLARKGRSGTLTRKWSLVQIQYGSHSGHLHGNESEPRTWKDPDPRRRSSRGSRSSE